VRVSKGAELLRRKREALVAEIVRLARPAADARALIAERAARAYPVLVGALGVEGYAGLRAIAWPLREVTLQIRPAQVWGIPVAEIVARPPLRRTLEARGIAASAIGPAAAASASEFETLAELLLDAAPRELLLQRLGFALTRTSRQVNTLEHRVAPSIRREVLRARRTLEEREREEHTRLGWLLRGRR
jgi:V/A-type H+-transporting ATPase subunit D